MNNSLAFLMGLSLGSCVMFVLDPDRGGRRRALIRDRLVSAAHETHDAVTGATTHLGNRATGKLARIKRRFFGPMTVSDRVLADRVRAQLGRLVSHPRAVDVTARHGVVEVSGPVLRDERASLLAAIAFVPGIVKVEDRLDVHDWADVPALQGGVTRIEASRPERHLRPALGASLGLGVIAAAALYAARRANARALLAGEAGHELADVGRP